MGLWQDADAAGKELQAKREAERIAAEKAEAAKAEAAAEQKQHEEDKKQGMI